MPVFVAAQEPTAGAFRARIGFPGEPPFTRGVRATMYRGRLWTMRQYAGFGTAKETNRRFKYLFAHGNEGLSVAFDLPTQMGYDSDAPMARGEVGRVGVAISSVEDMQALLEGLPLDRVSTSMTINATAAILLALYVATGEARGIARRSLRGTVQNDILKEYIALLEEVAKFRAARRLWASIMAERFHARKPESLELRFHAQTAGIALTAQQPENNAVRVAIQALAAVLGGAQSLHTNSMDEALSLPSEKAVRVAVRTQQILAHESGVANTVDPVGGSFAIESLTDRLESEAVGLIRETDRRGGMLKAIETGWVQRQIADSAYRVQVELERGERTVVGVNAYAEGDERVPVTKTDPRLEPERIRQVRAFRANRRQGEVDSHLHRLEDDARSDANLVPAILDSVRAHATLGEISDVLRVVFGPYKPKQAGFELVDAEPRRGSQGRLVAFVHPRSLHGVLLELVEEPPKPTGRTQDD